MDEEVLETVKGKQILIKTIREDRINGQVMH